LIHKYSDVVSIDNLLLAWREFVRGKHNRKDVQEFSLRLMNNILALHEELTQQLYSHSAYHAFRISDPKPRQIHKATVRDRIVHRAIYRILYPYFHQRFIYDSYSCRLGKGTQGSQEICYQNRQTFSQRY
jgi:retron-type reverse transcriptase